MNQKTYQKLPLQNRFRMTRRLVMRRSLPVRSMSLLKQSKFQVPRVTLKRSLTPISHMVRVGTVFSNTVFNSANVLYVFVPGISRIASVGVSQRNSHEASALWRFLASPSASRFITVGFPVDVTSDGGSRTFVTSKIPNVLSLIEKQFEPSFLIFLLLRLYLN